MICEECHCEMVPNKNDIKMRWNKSYVRHGDRYTCRQCGIAVIRFCASTKPYMDYSDNDSFFEVKIES